MGVWRGLEASLVTMRQTSRLGEQSENPSSQISAHSHLMLLLLTKRSHVQKCGYTGAHLQPGPKAGGRSSKFESLMTPRHSLIA